MNEIFQIIISQAAIWVPSLVAVLGIITTVLKSLNATKAELKRLREDETIKKLAKDFQDMAAANDELVYSNKLLLDEITHIKGYADALKEEKKPKGE